MVGDNVEITSQGGIAYRGVVRSILEHELGELFTLGSATDPEYERLVIVSDRARQVRRLDDDE